MHCENFCNINGIQIKMFQPIIELNLSSNNLSEIGELSVLKHIRNLNLSCNKITQIQGLDGMIGSLRRLVLSHNRIASLQYFATIIQNGQSAPHLATIDLNDNYISGMQQVRHFRPIISLKEVIFQMSNSSNPICDLQGYND